MDTPTKPPPRRQCAKCPWKKGVDPRQIPHGYNEEKHRALRSTIAEPGDMRPSTRRMACHETEVGAERECVGWLMHQLGPGNNIALRLEAAAGVLDVNVETVGEQHWRFEDTLPKARRR